MSRDVFLKGYNVGYSAAARCRALVRDCERSEDLGRLAGRRLLELLARDDTRDKYEYSFSDHWRCGYFEGFMVRSEEIRLE